MFHQPKQPAHPSLHTATSMPKKIENKPTTRRTASADPELRSPGEESKNANCLTRNSASQKTVPSQPLEARAPNKSPAT